MPGLHLFEDESKGQKGSESESKVDYLSFYVGDDLYAVSLMKVKEVVEYAPVKKIPKSSDYFMGLFNLRGDVAGLIDLATKFDTKKKFAPESSPVVMFDTENGPLGILVDKMFRVIQIDRVEIKDPSSVKSNVPLRYLEGFVTYNDSILILLDLQLLLDEDDITKFRKN